MNPLHQKLKILHLEDVETDAELVARELKKGGLNFELIRVDNEKDFAQSLREFLPDVILSDHSLPSFTSFGALKIVHDFQINVPFLLVTSATSEEIAASVMKEGAWDYILKDRMQRLPKVITNAVEKWQAEKEKENYYNELIRSAQKLKQNQFFLEKASEAAKIGYWTAEPDFENGKLTWSKEVFSIFQLEESEFDGKNSSFFRLAHPDDRERLRQLVHIAMVDDQIFNIDHRIVLKNGNVRWVNQRAQFVRNEKNEVTLMVGIVQDINDRKIIEEVLREYNDRYEILSKATNDVIWDWDIVNDSISYSQSIHLVLGYQDFEINSESSWWEEHIHADDRESIITQVKEMFANKITAGEFSYRYRTSTNNYKYIRDRCYVVYNKKGNPTRMIGAMQDVTEIIEYRLDLEKKVKDRTKELNEALQKEKELVEMKSRFVSIASHEFRTPLSTISLASGFIKKFKKRMTSDELDEKLVNIETQVNHMSALLDDVLTIGKGEAGKINVEWKELDIKSTFETLALEVINSTRRSHTINLKIDCYQKVFKTDEGLIRNVTINLLINAIKFSPDSTEVEFLIYSNEIEMKIHIRDFGVGILDEDKEKLFEPFYRGKNVTSIPGTGLGLSIVKKAVDLLAGSIQVNSKLGAGTEFIVTLPLR